MKYQLTAGTSHEVTFAEGLFQKINGMVAGTMGGTDPGDPKLL
jgi:hypothetical protein